MPPPIDPKDAAVYHTILSDMHRLHAMTLNLASIEQGETAAALREHFGREQRILAGKLTEWRGHRSRIFEMAERDFAGQRG